MLRTRISSPRPVRRVCFLWEPGPAQNRSAAVAVLLPSARQLKLCICSASAMCVQHGWSDDHTDRRKAGTHFNSGHFQTAKVVAATLSMHGVTKGLVPSSRDGRPMREREVKRNHTPNKPPTSAFIRSGQGGPASVPPYPAPNPRPHTLFYAM